MAIDGRRIIKPGEVPGQAAPQLVQHPSGANLILAMCVDMDQGLASALADKIADKVIEKLDNRVAMARAGVVPFTVEEAIKKQEELKRKPKAPKAGEAKVG